MNFSISEIIVILLIAMLVIKPEQMPEVAFTLGQFTKSIRKMFAKVKDEMNGIIESVDAANDTKREQP